MHPDALCTAAHATEYLGLGKDRIKKLVADGDLAPAKKVNKKGLELFRFGDVVDANETEPTK